MIDDRTSNLNLPKPNAANLLLDDVARLRTALDGIDTSVAGKAAAVHGHAITDVTGLQTALDGKQALLGFTAENAANKGAANGYAGLDGGGKVPSSQLPSYVDDVVEAANYAALPATGETGKIYVLLTPYTSGGVTSAQFRWTGSAYTPIVSSPGSTDAVPEGSTNLYFTSARALAAVPVATASVVGRVKPGSGLSVSGDGTLSVSGAGQTFEDVLLTVATNGQTAFTVTYTVGAIDVYLNGVKLNGGGDDFTASSGTGITLTVGASTTDTLIVRRWSTFEVANAATLGGVETLQNKTLVDPKLTLGGTNGTVGQVPLSQGAGLAPVWGNASTFQTGDILYTNRELSAPNWLPADGSVYLQSSYSALYAEVGLLPSNSAAAMWTSRTSGFGTSPINGVTYGNGLYVAVGNSGKLTTSPDGITWTSRTSGFGTTTINGVTYGNGLYVAVGTSGALTTSPDGITWTSRTSGFGTIDINDVTYGNGLYVAVGASGRLTTSPDGITWTSRTSGFGTSPINGVTYGDGLYVAVGASGALTTSPDGITWTSRTSGFGTIDINGVTYGNGLYVAVGTSGALTTSPDGITWTSRTSGFGTSQINGVTYGNGLYVAVGASGALTTSPDGITWTSKTSGFGTAAINNVTYGDGLYVVVGASGLLATSTFGYEKSTQFATPISNVPRSAGIQAYIKT